MEAIHKLKNLRMIYKLVGCERALSRVTVATDRTDHTSAGGAHLVNVCGLPPLPYPHAPSASPTSRLRVPVDSAMAHGPQVLNCQLPAPITETAPATPLRPLGSRGGEDVVEDGASRRRAINLAWGVGGVRRRGDHSGGGGL